MANQGDLFCEHCERVRGKHDGPRTPQDFEFAIGEIAASLYDLASGASYRGTSKLRRREIDRPARIPVRDRDPFSSQGHLARDWLEEFGWIVLDGKEYRAWPRILVLDNKGYRPKLRMPHRGGFHVYAALDAVRQQVVRLTYYPDRSYWWAFLDQLPGEPEVVVVDSDPAILGAIAFKWPKARIWRSHWHIQHRQLTNGAIPREGSSPGGIGLPKPSRTPFAPRTTGGRSRPPARLSWTDREWAAGSMRMPRGSLSRSPTRTSCPNPRAAWRSA